MATRIAGRSFGCTEQRARRLLVIYNPTAGRRARGRIAAWLAALERLGAPITVRETERPGHAEELARAADPERYDAVAVAGGDGTINEVANGLAGSSLPMAILPLGTANVLAAELDLPRDPASLARIAALAPARTVWPGEILFPGAAGGRLFLLMAGVGFDAEVIEHLDLALKRRTGKAAYAVSILARMRHYRDVRYRAVIDGETIDSASLVAARAHFYGGRFVLAPAARLDDPHLHVVLFERGGRGAVLAYLAAMLRGTISRRPDVRILRAERVELIAPEHALVHADGDICGRLPVTLRVAEAPLRIVAPDRRP
jgi:diacylglycerol kinase (ATP)